MKMNCLIPMLPVRSMPASVRFYERLGFSVEDQHPKVALGHVASMSAG